MFARNTRIMVKKRWKSTKGRRSILASREMSNFMVVRFAYEIYNEIKKIVKNSKKQNILINFTKRYEY